jgi:hypothetical protein
MQHLELHDSSASNHLNLVFGVCFRLTRCGRIYSDYRQKEIEAFDAILESGSVFCDHLVEVPLQFSDVSHWTDGDPVPGTRSSLCCVSNTKLEYVRDIKSRDIEVEINSTNEAWKLSLLVCWVVGKEDEATGMAQRGGRVFDKQANAKSWQYFILFFSPPSLLLQTRTETSSVNRRISTRTSAHLMIVILHWSCP